MDNPDNRQPLLSLPFVACGVILVVAAIGLQPTLATVIKKFSKERIELRRVLDDFDVTSLPSFRIVPGGGGFDALFRRLYLDSVGTKDVLRLLFEQRLGAQPDSTLDDVTLMVSYYSDPRDTVPHTPEV